MFPSRLLSKMLQVKIQQKPVDIEEGEKFMITEHGTPTSQRENDNFEEHALAAMSPNDETEIEEDLDLGMGENLFNLLENRAPPSYDWSKNYQQNLTESLPKLAQIFYQQERTSILSGKEGHLKLFNEGILCPENCKGDAQKFLIYHHLYYHYKIE